MMKDSAIGKLYQAMIQPLVSAVSPKYFIGAIVGGLAKAALAKKAAKAAGKGLAKTGMFGRKMMNNPGAFGNLMGGFFGGNPLGGLGALGKGVGMFGKAGGFGSGAGRLAQMMGKSGAGRALQGGFQGMMGGLGAPGAQMNPALAAIGGAGEGMVANMPKLQGIMNKGLFGGGKMGQGTGIFGGQGGFGSGQGGLSTIGKGGEGFMGKFGTGEGAIGNMAPDFRTGQGKMAQIFNKGGAGNTGNMGYPGQRGPFGQAQTAARQTGFGGQMAPTGGNPATGMPGEEMQQIWKNSMMGAPSPTNPSSDYTGPNRIGGMPNWMSGAWKYKLDDRGARPTVTTKGDENDAYNFLNMNKGGWI